MALAIDQRGGRVTAVSLVQVLKGDGERGDANMVMSVMWKKINEDGKDCPERESRKKLRALGRAILEFLDGIQN